MLRLERVTIKNVWDILKLSVSEEQRSFVASNEVSIIEAYTVVAADGHVFPFGIFDQDVPVGFLMIAFDTDDDWGDAPAVAKGNYNLWRLMIDKRYQNKGYGKMAVKLAIDFMKTFPCGAAELCWVSYVPENRVARRLYQTFGFVETGELNGKEMIAALTL